MSRKVVAHSYSLETVVAFFCKYPPHTEVGSKYFTPYNNPMSVSEYSRIDILPDYQQLQKNDKHLPYILHTPSGCIYDLPRYGHLLACEELQHIALELGELVPEDIVEVPEGCTYWIDWEAQDLVIEYPYKEVIRDLLDIVKRGSIENISAYHIYTQKLLSGEYSID